ncbi:MAG: cyclic nucleotide-binding domain-containing protein, partial [Gemmatimonadaceae bacterium]
MPSYTDAVGELPILQFLPDKARERIVGSFTPVSFTFGAPIVREGEPADALFVLVSGRARVLKNADPSGASNGELSLGVLRPGDTFGEIGLLLTGQRTATVLARTPMRLL